jgi:hypothetical protein
MNFLPVNKEVHDILAHFFYYNNKSCYVSMASIYETVNCITKCYFINKTNSYGLA